MNDKDVKMKIVVIGGTGLIGSKLVANLLRDGHEAVAAAPSTGVDTLTGAGLAEVLEGASVVVDVSNSPSFEEQPATDFFTRSTTNLLSAESEAGVKHHVALSVVGTEALAKEDGIGGYFRAKQAQENLIKASPIPYSIVHATQFFEFMKSIADASTDGETVRLPSVKVQPMAADDVASAVEKVALSNPINGITDIAGPDVFGLNEFVRIGFAARNDPRNVVTDETAGYFGAPIGESTLVPTGDADIGSTSLADWLSVAANVDPPQKAGASSAR